MNPAGVDRQTSKVKLQTWNCFILIFFCLLLLKAIPSRAEHDAVIYRAHSSNPVSLAELVRELKGARVVTIGEQHDNRRHHEIQLRIIRVLHECGLKIAVGLEQFGARSQPVLDEWIEGNIDTGRLFEVYSRDWEFNWWHHYSSIFIYARRHQIPLVGLNVPREIVRQVASDGFGSLTEEQRGKIRVLSCNIDQKYQNALLRVLGNRHSESQDTVMFNHFCEAQVVWDTSMALNALDFIKANPDTLVVILAGNFHAWKLGIPEQIRRESNIPVKVILPHTDTSFPSYEVFLEDADYVWGEE